MQLCVLQDTSFYCANNSMWLISNHYVCSHRHRHQLFVEQTALCHLFSMCTKWNSLMIFDNDLLPSAQYDRLVGCLPSENSLLLKHVLAVLHRVHLHSHDNQMNAFNLAICIAPSMLSGPAFSSPELEGDGAKKVGEMVTYTVISYTLSYQIQYHMLRDTEVDSIQHHCVFLLLLLFFCICFLVLGWRLFKWSVTCLWKLRFTGKYSKHFLQIPEVNHLSILNPVLLQYAVFCSLVVCLLKYVCGNLYITTLDQKNVGFPHPDNKPHGRVHHRRLKGNPTNIMDKTPWHKELD